MAQQSTRGAVIRNGLIFGVILGALDVGNAIVQGLTDAYSVTTQPNSVFTSLDITMMGASAILGCAIFLAMLGLTFIAGALAARRTGKVGAGSLAGLLAGSVAGLLGGVASAVVILTLLAPAIQASGDGGATPAQAPGLLIGMGLGALGEGLLVNGGFGAGLGALGGLMGASFYRNANPPAYQTPFYSGAPWQPGAYAAAPYPDPQYPSAPYSGPQYPTPYAPPPPYPGASYPAPPYSGRNPPTTPEWYPPRNPPQQD